MTLPAHNRTKHESTIDGLEGTLVFSPFTVADRRNLIATLSFEDRPGFVRTVVDIVERLSNLRELDEKLRLHFVEAVFMKIYAVSSGAVIEATYTCDNIISEPADAFERSQGGPVDDHACGEVTDIKIPIGDIRIDYGPLPPAASHVIKLGGSDDRFIELEVPGWEVVSGMMAAGEEIDYGDEFVLNCVKSIGGGGAVYTREDFTNDELAAWMNDMPEEDAMMVKTFFQNIPVIAKDFDITCPKCKARRRLVLRGLDSFFDFPTTPTN